MKKTIRKIHQWLGLGSGLLVFVIAITGCLYAFQQEIQDATQPYRFVQAQQRPFLPPSTLAQLAQRELPGKALHSVKYHKHDRAAEAIFFHFEPTYYYIVYLDPYNGKVLHTQDMESGFFPFVLKGHFYLWLPESIGQPVVASVTLVFLLMLITGLVLWFPKNKKAAKNRVWFKWKPTTKWKRRNFDLHAIVGFYSLLVALVFAITGLVWGFQWFANGLHTALGGEKPLAYSEPKSAVAVAKNPTALDQLFALVWHDSPQAAVVEVHPPESPTSTIAVNTNTEEGTYWKTDYRYFDQYTLAENPNDNLYSRWKDATFADKLLRMNYDLHTGAIFGLGGKIFMFLISLLVASLPVTGFLFWYGRTRKKA